MHAQAVSEGSQQGREWIVRSIVREASWEVLPVVQVGNEGDLNESGSGERVDSKMLSMAISSLGLPDDRLPHSGLQRVSAWRSLLPVPSMLQSPLSCF